MEKSMDRYLGQMLDNRYEILEAIGTGGMAIVYKALCHRLNRFVAVKILKDEYAEDAEFREHFKAESQAVAMLSHPNIVAVYDFSKSPDCQYIVMELLEGITLKQYMLKKGALSWREALHFSMQTAKALSHAHSKGIVHRDIKPQNIMVGMDGNIKVADFGIAHLENESNPNSTETMGSIHYISPEQARGEMVDARSDIYSLGIVMYEMLTGQLPYEGDSVEAIAVQHFGSLLTLPGDINPDIPIRLEQISLKAMTPDIEQRYQTADELLYDLEDFRKHQLTGDVSDDDQINSETYDSENPVWHVRPISRAGELSKKDYARRRIRARKVSTFFGIALVAIFALAIVAFLWKYWIEDIFVDRERMVIPSFIGQNVSEVTSDPDYEGIYTFDVTYAINPDFPEETIVSQTPEANRSMAPTSEGIKIKLIVSTGILMTEIPDLYNNEYRQAKITLEKLGFVVELTYVASEDIVEDYVISTQPAAGEKMPSGSTVYINVSIGPSTIEYDMPDLIGKTQDEARTILVEMGLSIGSVTESESTRTKGSIIWQNITPGDKVTRSDLIYLRVSTGYVPPPPTDTQTSPPDVPAETGG